MKTTKISDQNFQNKLEKNKQRLDSETYENSIKDINLDQTNGNTKERTYKKSIDIFPKKMSIEEPEEIEYKKRKYTLETNLIPKNFVPQIKPIKMYNFPSKLRLNNKGFKDLKRNKKNKVLMNAKKYFISCPNLDDEESDKNMSSKEIYGYKKKFSDNITDEIFTGNNNENIKNLRKDLQKIKNKNIPKILSKNNAVLKNKYDKDLDLGNSTDSDLYDYDELNNYSFNEKKEDNEIGKIIEQEKNNKRNRFNSWSILDILEKKYKLDDI